MAHFGGRVSAVVVADDRAYVGVGPRIVVFDVSDPRTPVRLYASDALPGRVARLFLAGPVLYAGVGPLGGGLWVLGVRTDGPPRVIGALALQDRVADVAVARAHVFVCQETRIDVLEAEAGSVTPRSVGAVLLPVDGYQDRVRVCAVTAGGTLVGQVADVAHLVDVRDPS